MTRYIKYVGTSHVRQITQAEWAALDPPVENTTLRWNQANGWTIPADMVSEHAWPYIEADDELIVIDRDYRGFVAPDVAEADVVQYPPLTTANQAEYVDQQSPQAVTEEPPPDQASGSVA